MKAHSVIFWAKTDEASGKYPFLSDANEKTSEFDNVTRVSENVWIVNLESAPTILGHLICAADANKVAYAILPLGDEPQWIQG